MVPRPHVVESWVVYSAASLLPLLLTWFYVGITLLHITYVMQEKLNPSQGPGWMQAGLSSSEPSLPLLEHLLVQGWTWNLNGPNWRERITWRSGELTLSSPPPSLCIWQPMCKCKWLLTIWITWGKQKHNALLTFFNNLANRFLSNFFLWLYCESRTDLTVSDHFYY